MPPNQAQTESGLHVQKRSPGRPEPFPRRTEAGAVEERSEEKLQASQARLRALSARLQQVREEERSRVARDIHDELGQALTGLKLDLSWIADNLPDGQRTLRSRIRDLSRRVEAAIRTVRRIVTTLRPGLLDDLGLAAALEWQAQEFRAHTGIGMRFSSTLGKESLDRDLSTSVFRIFQEALTNIARHARATAVEVRVGRENGRLLLEVRDDGRGITDADLSARGALGLLGMRERALAHGGELRIRAAPQGGTEVRLVVPLGTPGGGGP